MERCVLGLYEDIDYALVYLPQNKVTPFVCAWAPTFEGEKIHHWGQGHYFVKIEDAVEYINEKRRKNV